MKKKYTPSQPSGPECPISQWKKALAKTGVSSYSNHKALTESAFPDSQERDGGWCEPGELTEIAVAPELEAESL